MTWISDIGFSRSCNTKYFRKIDFYQHTKSIVAQLVEEQIFRRIKTLSNQLVNEIGIQRILGRLNFLYKK
jgi:hypothetical protein